MAKQRIVVVGAGHVGFYVAQRLSRKLSRDEAEITVVDPQPHMTYQPFLPEAAAGSIEPRHVVVPLRQSLRRCRVIIGAVTGIDHSTRTATVEPVAGPAKQLEYDHIVVAPGSVSRTLPIPGLREQAVGFKTLGEAIWLRNRVLERLDVAAATADPHVRRRALTFVLIGGGYAGMEALAELEDMARYALRYYPELGDADMRWVLVEATQRVLPEVGRDLGAYTVTQLLKRGLDIRLGTRLESCVDGKVELSDGERFESDTIVWTAGVRAHPMLAATDLPRDDKGRVTCLPTLQVIDGDRLLSGVWSAGDCAAVPDLTAMPEASVSVPSATLASRSEDSAATPASRSDDSAPRSDATDDQLPLCSPSAQHAVRQAVRLADNITAVIHGRPPTPYRHKHAGSVASLGLHKGVAHVYGFKLRGRVAWFLHRTYHMSRIPSFGRKVRVLGDWTLNLFLRREVISLGQLHEPREHFTSSS